MKINKDEFKRSEEKPALELFMQGIKAEETREKYTRTLKRILCVILEDFLEGTFDQRANQLVKIAKKDPKCLMAIKQHILQENRSRYNVIDGRTEPNYTVADGTYKITYNDCWISIVIDKEQIKLMSFWSKGSFLKEFMNTIYSKYLQPEDTVLFYGSKDGSWSFPIFRTPRKLENIMKTDDMNKVLDDIKNFTKKYFGSIK